MVKHSGRLWINGEFGVSRIRETPFLLERENDSHSRGDREVMESLIADFGMAAMAEWVLGRLEEGKPPLGSSKVSKPHRPRAKRGSKGVTSWGKKMLKNAALLLERESGKETLSFATLTVPGCSLEDYQAVAESWGEVVRVFLQRLTRHLQRQGLTGECVSATEIQGERYQRTGVPALHLHVLFQGKTGRKVSWALKPEQLREMWKSSLQRFMTGEVYWGACENIQRVRKSASGYLGKYMSKGSRECKAMSEQGLQHLLPSAWWNCSFSLRRRTVSAGSVGQDIGECIIRVIEKGMYKVFSWLYPIVLESESTLPYIVGWTGCIKSEYVDIFLRTVKEWRS